MQRQEPTTDVTASDDRGSPLDQSRLRATLRLCFAPERADSLTSLVTWEARTEAEALRPVIRAARLDFASERLSSPFRRRRQRMRAERPLAPRFGVASDAALALALHLGLGLDIATLATVFSHSVHEISLALYEARQAIEPAELKPCTEFVAAIGRSRDPADAHTAERLAFLQHVATCSRCRPTLEATRALDDRLLGQIDTYERTLPAMPKPDHRRRAFWFKPALLWGVATLLIVTLLVGGTLGARHLLHNETPVPLLSAQAAGPALSGWLLQTSEAGEISAVNLASGEHRLLIPDVTRSSAQFTLSPDQRQITRLTDQPNVDAPATLAVYDLDGTVKHEWDRLSPTDVYLTLGWLNDTTVIVSSIPAHKPNETASAFSTRAQASGQLVAFDVSTGAQRVLFRGWVSGALVSLDGTRIGIVRQESNSESVVEIRPVTENGLGSPVTTSEQESTTFIPVTPLAWTSDHRLIFESQTTAGMTIQSLALDGTLTQVYQPDAGEFQSILSLSPNNAALIYATTQNPGAGPWIYWRRNLADGTTQKLATGGQGPNYTLLSQVVWSPDRAKLTLTLNEPFYMPNAAKSGSATSIAAQRVVAFDANGQALGSLLEQFSDQSLLAWLPEDALPSRAAMKKASPAPKSNFTSVGLAQLGGLQPVLTSDSRLSPDGHAALVYSPGYEFEMAVSPEGGDVQSAGLPDDPSWLPDSSGSVGVQHHTGNGGQISRIGVYGDIGTAGRSITDFDPVGLGDSTTAAYRYPMLSPDGLHCSFFVVTPLTVTLWIGDRNAGRTVASWQVPNGAKVDPPLIVRWINNTTLIYAEPDDWQNGLPRRVTLHRITLNTDSTTDTPLIDWQTHSSERGIVLQELRISADQAQLAIRLRHLTGSDPNKDAFDSIAAIDTSDLHQSVELARGTPGEGLSWSPDGTQLVAVTQKKLTVFTIQGGNTQQISTGKRTVSNPLWVLPNEIWYQSGSGTSSQMIRATR